MRASLSKRLSAFALAFVLMLSAMYVPAFASEAPAAESEVQTVESAPIVDEAAPVADEEKVSDGQDVRAAEGKITVKRDNGLWGSAAKGEEGYLVLKPQAGGAAIEESADGVYTVARGAFYDLYHDDKLIAKDLVTDTDAKTFDFYTFVVAGDDYTKNYGPVTSKHTSISYLAKDSVIAMPEAAVDSFGREFRFWTADTAGTTNEEFEFVDENGDPTQITEPIILTPVYNGSYEITHFNVDEKPSTETNGLKLVVSDTESYTPSQGQVWYEDKTDESNSVWKLENVYAFKTPAQVSAAKLVDASGVVLDDTLTTGQEFNLYTVNFTLGAGSGTAPAKQVVIDGGYAVAPSSEATAKIVPPSGMVFSYWKLAEDVDTRSLPNEHKFGDTDVVEAITLEAVYSAPSAVTVAITVDGKTLDATQKETADRITLIRNSTDKTNLPISATLVDGKYVFALPEDYKSESFDIVVDKAVFDAESAGDPQALNTDALSYDTLMKGINLYSVNFDLKNGSDDSTLPQAFCKTQFALANDTAEAAIDNIKLLAKSNDTKKVLDIHSWTDLATKANYKVDAEVKQALSLKAQAYVKVSADLQISFKVGGVDKGKVFNYGDAATLVVKSKIGEEVNVADCTVTYFDVKNNQNVERATAPTDAGSYVVGVFYRSEGKADYLEQAYTIAPKVLKVQFTNEVKSLSKIYGDADPSFAYTLTKDSTIVEGDPLTGSITRAAGEDVKVDDYVFDTSTLKSTKNDGKNYTVILEKKVGTGVPEFQILSREITIMPLATSSVFGEALKKVSFTTIGSVAKGDKLVGELDVEVMSGMGVGEYNVEAGTLKIVTADGTEFEPVDAPDSLKNYNFQLATADCEDMYEITKATAATVVVNKYVQVTNAEATVTEELEFLSDTDFVGTIMSTDLVVDADKDITAGAVKLADKTISITKVKSDAADVEGKKIVVRGTLTGFTNYNDISIVVNLIATKHAITAFNSLTINGKALAPNLPVWEYDKEKKAVKANAANDTDPVTPEIKYYKVDGEKVTDLNEQPVNVGTYKMVAKFVDLVDPAATKMYYGEINFEIDPVEIDLVWSNTETTFDGTDKMVTPKMKSDVIVLDPVTEKPDDVKIVSTLKNSALETVTATHNAGTYSAYATLEGADKENYAIVGDYALPVVTVHRAIVNVAFAADQELPYNGKSQLPSYTLTGLVKGAEDVSVKFKDFTKTGTSGNITEDEIKDVATYTATLDPASLNGKDKNNYQLSSTADITAKTYEIVPKNLSLDFTNTTVAYNGKTQAPTVKDSGLVEGDDVKLVVDFKVAGQTETYATVSSVGKYTATYTVDGTDKANYGFISGGDATDFEITPATLKANWLNLVQEYTGSALEPILAFTGLANDELVDYNLTFKQDGKEVTEAKEIGKYEVTATLTGSKAGNYVIDEPTVTFEIVKEWENPFTDVDPNRFYYNGVRFVVEAGLMQGVDTNLFAPMATTNRAMIATVLYRMAGEPEVTEPSGFVDVPAGKYYSDAVAWGASVGLMKGYEGNQFRPMQTVTRQELVTFIYRMAEYNELDVSDKSDLKDYVDANKVMNYAKDAFGWAVAAGVVSGKTTTTLDPTGTATRGEVATMVTRFFEWAFIVAAIG